MNLLPPVIQDCVTSLVKAWPFIEDIWLLEASAAKECGLEKATNLIVIIPNGEEAHIIEEQMRAKIFHLSEGAGVDIFVFPLMAVDRIPRPLMVKMALTSGRKIYCN